MKEPVNKFLSVLPLLLMALLVMMGFLWYTGRLALNFEPLTTYANPLLGVSFRYPKEWQPDTRYGAIGNVSGRYAGENGFFGVDALSTDQDLETIAKSIASHQLKPYGKTPQILSLNAGRQEARVIIPSKDQQSEQKEVALIVRYPRPLQIQSTAFQYVLVVGDPAHIKVFADTLEFN